MGRPLRENCKAGLQFETCPAPLVCRPLISNRQRVAPSNLELEGRRRMSLPRERFVGRERHDKNSAAPRPACRKHWRHLPESPMAAAMTPESPTLQSAADWARFLRTIRLQKPPSGRNLVEACPRASDTKP